MFIYGQYNPEHIINTSCDKDGNLEYILTYKDTYKLYKLSTYTYNLYPKIVVNGKKTYGNTAVPTTFFTTLPQSYTEEALDIIDRLRHDPVKNIPMDFLEKIR